MLPTKAVPSDYDTNSERFCANVQAVEQYGLVQDVHEEVADRLATD